MRKCTTFVPLGAECVVQDVRFVFQLAQGKHTVRVGTVKMSEIFRVR